ncbi:uncharacterized protein Bfra_000463, partial [Botrytis fragariae]
NYFACNSNFQADLPGARIWYRLGTTSQWTSTSSKTSQDDHLGLEHGIDLSWTVGVKSIPDDIIQGGKEKEKGKPLFLHLKYITRIVRT